MKSRRSIVLVFSLILIGVGAFWVRSSVADTPRRLTLPGKVPPVPCDLSHSHLVSIAGVGTFQESPAEARSPLIVKVGQQYRSKTGQKVVPLRVVAIEGKGFAEGIGETRFWLDPTRPMTSMIWEKKPGTEFPAIQEMKFHFFYTLDAMPGKIFRSITPAKMRSNDVRAFPPPSGTVYHLLGRVELEDVAESGVVVGEIRANRIVVP